jgi:hypothetical protein
VINYRNHRGKLINEVLTFDGAGLVREGQHLSGANRIGRAVRNLLEML